MQKYKFDDTYNLIIYELSESLLMYKLHSFIFDNLKNFNSEDEAELKNKLISFRQDFSFTSFKLDQIFNECQFNLAIEEVKKLKNYQTPFEKMVN
jgi:hypothetical protein